MSTPPIKSSSDSSIIHDPSQEQRTLSSTDEKVSVFSMKFFKYITSLTYYVVLNKVKHLLCNTSVIRKWSNPIMGLNGEDLMIELGGIPMNGVEGGLRGLLDKTIGAVLSLVEPFEFEKSLFGLNKPLVAEDYENDRSIEQLHVITEDFKGLEVETFTQAVDFLNEQIDQLGKRAYVHCKAGVGRSASVVIAYLVVWKGYSFEEAYRITKSSRPVVNINAEQKDKIFAFMRHAHDEGYGLGDEINLTDPVGEDEVWTSYWDKVPFPFNLFCCCLPCVPKSWRAQHDKEIIRA